jgi:hypothetical protein
MPQPSYERAPEHDKRFAWGDDYAGDAWRDKQTGAIRWTAVGVNINNPYHNDQEGA